MSMPEIDPELYQKHAEILNATLRHAIAEYHSEMTEIPEVFHRYLLVAGVLNHILAEMYLGAKFPVQTAHEILDGAFEHVRETAKERIKN